MISISPWNSPTKLCSYLVRWGRCSVKERLSAIRVGNALLSMGYERTRAGNLRGYRVVEVPFADIERKQKDMGKFTDTPNEDTALKGEEDMQPELPF